MKNSYIPYIPPINNKRPKGGNWISNPEAAAPAFHQFFLLTFQWSKIGFILSLRGERGGTYKGRFYCTYFPT